MTRYPSPEQKKVLGIVADWMHEVNNRNEYIIKGWKEGRTTTELAERFGISRTRIHQIINKFKKKEELKLRLEKTPLQVLEEHDKLYANCQSWAHKVSLLMPHIEAIRAIAEEKNT